MGTGSFSTSDLSSVACSRQHLAPPALFSKPAVRLRKFLHCCLVRPSSWKRHSRSVVLSETSSLSLELCSFSSSSCLCRMLQLAAQGTTICHAKPWRPPPSKFQYPRCCLFLLVESRYSFHTSDFHTRPCDALTSSPWKKLFGESGSALHVGTHPIFFLVPISSRAMLRHFFTTSSKQQLLPMWRILLGAPSLLVTSFTYGYSDGLIRLPL